MWKSFLLRKAFPSVENRDVFHRDFLPFSTKRQSAQSKTAAGGKTVLHTTDSPYYCYYCFPLFFSVLFSSAHSAADVQNFLRKKRWPAKRKDRPFSPMLPQFRLCRRGAAHAEITCAYPADRKTPIFPSAPSARHRLPGKKTDARPSVRRPSVCQSIPPTQTSLRFSYSVRSPVPFAGRWRTRKNIPQKNNSINPKGRNKCTLSFRKKCCWTI